MQQDLILLGGKLAEVNRSVDYWSEQKQVSCPKEKMTNLARLNCKGETRCDHTRSAEQVNPTIPGVVQRKINVHYGVSSNALLGGAAVKPGPQSAASGTFWPVPWEPLGMLVALPTNVHDALPTQECEVPANTRTHCALAKCTKILPMLLAIQYGGL